MAQAALQMLYLLRPLITLLQMLAIREVFFAGVVKLSIYHWITSLRAK